MLERLRAMPTPVDYSRYRSDPVGFARGKLGSGLWAGQERILKSVRDNEVTIVKSANAVGKTFVAADAGLWFLRCFEGAQVYMTAAPPLGNLRRLLWGEVEKKVLEHLGVFGVEPGDLRLKLGPRYTMEGVTIPASGSHAKRVARFSGKHAPALMFIVDEGDAVPDAVYEGIESCMSNEFVRLLILFNPREQAGPVYRKEIGGQAHVIELDAFEHPNVRMGREVIPGAVSRKVTVRRIVDWSRAMVEGDRPDEADPDWFRVAEFLDGATVLLDDGARTAPLVGGEWRKVTNPALSYMTLARYPGQAENQLISRAWVQRAQQRWLAWRAVYGDKAPEGIRPVVGVDVAEFGLDRNVCCVRYGGWVAPFESWGGVDVLVTGDRAAARAQEVDARECFTDATGVGSGVGPQMRRWWAAHRDAERPFQGHVTEVKVAEAPTMRVEEGEFGLLRDQLWWKVREWLRKDAGAMLPPSEGLADELCAVQYRVHRGKIQVSDKDALRKLLGRSPDLADALGLTFAPKEGSGINL